jgi:hypothetical protein
MESFYIVRSFSLTELQDRSGIEIGFDGVASSGRPEAEER